jgi:simple sugar transport system ATP-binding protein
MPVEKLSGGQRQAVAIGRAVSFNPKLVIMDEPTASLALKEVNAVLDLIGNLRERGISVILISHRLQDVFRVADRITVLRAGEAVATHVTRDVSMDDIVSLMFLGRERQGR